ncbi:uncharacterized protein SAPINGB_P005262 [Magnusiomyces paraingens]|uniref:Uncharacterized protein n=1 Tax=Magnusiomyces paraingens TaxID=2606893 RepID=A0A5E8C1L8_9ASCO|nr:uncharacterized protein SAPINGB_P005262 [Saprochaete ingens]VVT56775.1 unnamed protein product [Saprochaete ingens]
MMTPSHKQSPGTSNSPFVENGSFKTTKSKHGKTNRTIKEYVAQQCAAVEKRTRQQIQEAIEAAATYTDKAKVTAVKDASSQIDEVAERLTALIAEQRKAVREETQCKVRVAVDSMMEYMDSKIQLLSQTVPAESKNENKYKNKRENELEGVIRKLDERLSISEESLGTLRAALTSIQQQIDQKKFLTRTSKTMQKLLDLCEFVDVEEWPESSTLRCQVEELVAMPLREHILQVDYKVGNLSKTLGILEQKVLQLTTEFEAKCEEWKLTETASKQVPLLFEKLIAQRENLKRAIKIFEEKKRGLEEDKKVTQKETEKLEKRVKSLERQIEIGEKVQQLTTNNMVMEVNARALRNDLKHLEEKVERLAVTICQMDENREVKYQQSELQKQEHKNENEQQFFDEEEEEELDEKFWDRRGEEFEAMREQVRLPTVESIYTDQDNTQNSTSLDDEEWDFEDEQEKYRTIGTRDLKAYQVSNKADENGPILCSEPTTPLKHSNQVDGSYFSPGSNNDFTTAVAPLSPLRTEFVSPKAATNATSTCTLTRQFGQQLRLAQTAGLFESGVAEAAAGSPYYNSQRLGRLEHWGSTNGCTVNARGPRQL